jgi:hypothetical protein
MGKGARSYRLFHKESARRISRLTHNRRFNWAGLSFGFIFFQCVLDVQLHTGATGLHGRFGLFPLFTFLYLTGERFMVHSRCLPLGPVP